MAKIEETEKGSERTPNKSAFKSRNLFVEEVAREIVENHGKHSGSFIFGISGKWGEGKTTFLNDLKKEIESEESNDFVVRDGLSPWRFGADKIAFLRTFLGEIYGDRETKLEERFPEIYHNTNKTIVEWPKFFRFILFGLLAVYSPIILPYFFNINLDYLQAIEPISSVIFILIVIPILLKTVTIQKNDQAVSTLDRFDFVLTEILKEYNGKKILVFVDDLDRVTPSIARSVIDNLRTFFDKKNLSFVVTGDHFVLESHLGRELLPKSEKPEQQEEGRRFLKKIFNIYWRLPLPIKDELHRFVESEIEKKKMLKDIFSESEIKILIRSLEQYFEKNLRQIKRFIEQIIFTFKIINAQHQSSSKQAETFEEQKTHPLLVVRILMIQELCTPLFEKIIDRKSLLYDLEREADQNQKSVVNEMLGDSDKVGDLSPSQKRFITDFLYQKPRFVEKKIIKVKNIAPFIHLAADASLSDERGFSSIEDFVSLLPGSPDELQEAITNSGPKKLEEAADTFVEKFNGVSPLEKHDLLNKLVVALIGIPTEHAAHKIFIDKLKSLDFAFYSEIPPQDKSKHQPEVWKWMDHALADDGAEMGEELASKFTYSHQQDLTQLELNNDVRLGLIGSTVVIKWFNEFFTQNNTQVQAIDKLVELLPYLDKEVVKNTIDADILLNHITSTEDTSLRNKIIELFFRHLSSHKKGVKEKVLDHIQTLDQNFFSWAEERTSSEYTTWDKKDLEMAIIKKIQDGVTNEEELMQVLRFAANNIRECIYSLWEQIRVKHEQLFMNIFDRIIDDSHFKVIPPPPKIAKIFLKKIVSRIIARENISEQEVQLDLLKKEKWIWENLSSKDGPGKIRFVRITKSENQQAKDTLEGMVSTWKSE